MIQKNKSGLTRFVFRYYLFGKAGGAVQSEASGLNSFTAPPALPFSQSHNAHKYKKLRVVK